ncbi:MAG: twin-arginine translocation signal domain-containing protein, partial [Terriglobales bacterium]
MAKTRRQFLQVSGLGAAALAGAACATQSPAAAERAFLGTPA